MPGREDPAAFWDITTNLWDVVVTMGPAGALKTPTRKSMGSVLLDALAGNRSTIANMPLTFAYLGSDGVPRATDYQGWRRWFEGGGERQMKIKRSHTNGWQIDTWFQGCSTSEDSPFLFWEVSANHSSWSPLVRRFGTKEEALKYQAFLVKEARADRLQDILENFYL